LGWDGFHRSEDGKTPRREGRQRRLACGPNSAPVWRINKPGNPALVYYLRLKPENSQALARAKMFILFFISDR
jgi:hypothetical protein